jgi:hypothetical protein
MKTLISILLTVFTVNSIFSQTEIFDWRKELPVYLMHGHNMYKTAYKISEPLAKLNYIGNIIQFIYKRDGINYNVFYDSTNSEKILYLIDNKHLKKQYDSLISSKVHFNSRVLGINTTLIRDMGNNIGNIVIELQTGHVKNTEGGKKVLDVQEVSKPCKIIKLSVTQDNFISSYREYLGDSLCIGISFGRNRLPYNIEQSCIINDSSRFLSVLYNTKNEQIENIHTYKSERSLQHTEYSFLSLEKEKRPESVLYYFDGIILYSIGYYRRRILSAETFGDANNKNISVTYFYRLNIFNNLHKIVYYDAKFKDRRIYSIQFRFGKQHTRTIYSKDPNNKIYKVIFYNRKHQIKRVKIYKNEI